MWRLWAKPLEEVGMPQFELLGFLLKKETGFRNLNRSGTYQRYQNDIWDISLLFSLFSRPAKE
jgi:hypothetical protein